MGSRGGKGGGGGDDGDGDDDKKPGEAGFGPSTSDLHTLRYGQGQDVSALLLRVFGIHVTARAIEMIPSEVRASAKMARDGDGVRFGNKRDHIRIMMADPKAKYPSQHQPYVKITRDGQVVNDRGERVREGVNGEAPKARADAHIPLRDWNYWTKWYKP